MSASPELLAIDSRLRVQQRQHSHVANFITVAHQMLVHEDRDRFCFALDQRLDTFAVEPFQKAAVTTQTFDEVWQGGQPLEMAARYLESIADASILDAVKKAGATMLPEIGHLVVGSGVSASVVGEGAPKIVQHLDMTGLYGTEDRIKCAAMIVLSKELAGYDGFAVRRLFEKELKNAVVTASNSAFLAQLLKTPIATMPWKSADGVPYRTIRLRQGNDERRRGHGCRLR